MGTQAVSGWLATLLVLGSVGAAGAASWVDWTTAGASTVEGSLTFGSVSVDVTYSGPYSFAQTTGGTDYWNPPAPYVSGSVPSGPPDPDIVALSTGGPKTITFSTAVQDPLIALVSWNGVQGVFNGPIEFLSTGAGFWGSGGYSPVGQTGFVGVGELHGVIRLPGQYSSITFTDWDESWHGITVGAMGLANAVPEPGTLLLVGFGLVGLTGSAGRRAEKQGPPLGC